MFLTAFTRTSLLFIALCTMPLKAYGNHVSFNFCYENKEFLPHFVGNSTLVPDKRPGALIEVLKRLDELTPEVSINFIRKPWVRCLSQLKDGKVSGVIGSYSDERSRYAIYPTVNGELDKSRAIDNLATCLMVSRKAPIPQSEVTTIAVPFGYIVASQLKASGYEVYETDSLTLAHQLLSQGRVSASVIDCSTEVDEQSFLVLPQPIREHQGYLMVSRSFERSYPNIVKQMWLLLSQMDREEFYEKYQ